MQEINRFDDLSDFLASCVNKIKSSYPKFSSLQLAKRLGIPNSTFDRISKKEVQKPSFNYALKIVQEVCGEESVQKFIKEYYPSMYEDFSKVYSGNQDVPFVSAEAEAYFRDPTTYEIMLMATTEAGLSKEVAKDEFGRKGLTILEKLIADKVLIEKDGKVSISGAINANQETVHKLFTNLVQMNYDVDAFGNKDNWLSLQYISANAEYVLPKLLEIYKRANGEIREVFNSPMAQGNDIVWAGLVMDTLSKRNDQSTGVLQ
ncbi:MAG: hypothetical protein VXV96_11585 [Bdellovibrionota bacterium]|nr:hypothetical protein [Bdellovibrionota bacterium]